MRILELDLDRYGPVTGMRLAFRPDARVHIVFSADGAGGSWAPAAIADNPDGLAAISTGAPAITSLRTLAGKRAA